MRRCLLAGLLVLSGVELAQAQSKVIRLRNETIPTARASAPAPAAKAVERPVSGLLLVQLTQALKPEWREALRATGVDLLHYVPDDAFVARAKTVSLADLRRLPFVHWVGDYRPEHKMQSALGRVRIGESAAVSILLAPDTAVPDAAAVRQSLEQIHQESKFRFGTVLRGTLASQQLANLARSDSVLWIEPAPKMQLFDEVSSRIVAGTGNTPNTTAMMNLGFDGAGVTVAVADSGLDSGEIDSMHPDIAGRVTALFYYGSLTDAADEHSHGTHVAGIVAGNGATGEMDENSLLYGLGVAPGASLIAQRLFDGTGGYQPPSSFEKLTRDAKRAGADVGSNSWGDDTQGRYDLSAMEFDALVRDADALRSGDQPYILEFSAGNAGPASRTIGSPAVAKNVIATGAANSDRLNLPIEEFSIYSDGPDTMADFSSRGPCEDGRIKPDVVAPGTWIASLRSVYANDENAWWPISDNYMYQGGTSQAGPHASGAAAVFVQFYRATHTNATPSPALVKAALINSATDMDDSQDTDAAPNMDEGWGRIDLPALIASTRNYEFLDQTALLTNGQIYERTLVVAGPQEPLKITLAYTDVPGLPAAVPALVNDLDLEVLSPDGHIYRGNQFQDGESLPDLPGPDAINNVEGVQLYAPVPGEYTVRVRASRIAQDARQDTPGVVDQDFALVISAVVAAPGVGLVTFDKPAYRVPDTITLRLVDYDLAGQAMMAVSLRSTTEPAGETITLRASGSTGIFTASVATATGPALADSKLQVAHGDAIEAVYQDAQPAGARTFIASADLQPPVISNVAVTNRFGQIIISWDTDEDAKSVLRYGTSTLNLSVTNPVLDFVHEIRLTNVVANQPYQFLVIAEDEAGNRATNDNGGALFTFTAVESPSLLLVDGYGDYLGLIFAPPLSGYTDALNQIGIVYDVFDATTGDLPTLEQLRSYRCVIWRISELESFPAAAAQSLTNYLRSGGSLLIASMEALSRFAESGQAVLNTNLLQVQSYAVDQPVYVVAGAPGEPVGAGIDVTLDYSPYDELLLLVGEENPSDYIVPTANATPILYSDTHVVGIRSPKPGRDLPGRVVFLSFPLDAVPLGTGVGNNRAGLLQNILNFLLPPAGNSTLALDSDVYSVPSRAVVEVEDSDLEGQGQATVNFTSPRQTNAVRVTLYETVRRGLFRGAVAVVPVGAGATNALMAAPGDTISAEYLDGSSGLTITATALIETTPPVLSNVDALPDYLEAWVSWNTSEPADALVQYSESRDNFPNNFIAYDGTLDTYHELLLTGLRSDRTYYFRLVSRDRAGNATIDDNNGTFYSFTTLKPIAPPWNDDLESGSSGWQVQTDAAIDSELEWELGVPGGGAVAHSPNMAWGCNLHGTSASWAESFLIGPALDLSGGNRATLRFWHKADFASDGGIFNVEGGEVMLYLPASGTLVTLESITDYAADWEELEYDLTPYTGGIAYVVWHYLLIALEEADTTGWLIDDVSVTMDFVPPGTVVVTNNLSQAVFELAGPRGSNWHGNWFLRVTNAPVGRYVVDFGDVPFYNTPPPQTNDLASASVLVFTGDYTFADANTNGLPDTWEQQYFGSATNHSPLLDSDHDGASDYAEFVAGTNPTNNASVLKMSASVPTGESLHLEWLAGAGRSYRILGSGDLLSWTPLTEWLRTPSGLVSQDVPQTAAYRFYRLEVRP
ncbi:MAG: S8 family serine peptidase [Verrucomicrobia bacterium]|nr:S8 family serine peptidase [Verrucomicrobiota bacterium]